MKILKNIFVPLAAFSPFMFTVTPVYADNEMEKRPERTSTQTREEVREGLRAAGDEGRAAWKQVKQRRGSENGIAEITR